ncbi:hypothetical protein P154DRAFT_618522 [Amniculicola lignicola CBS 123094]|uniref:Zn(2)-C6 fungal-type domain-containing protein n=1 Tax=Amniculicola lignicola CBS 123094 TaxID=1392246 RepID=A0A6A5WKJ2_9PLEO|nr:hypothetical protein P154DRAFT_618522 [Amniculicola lignicola CBS 123094]
MADHHYTGVGTRRSHRKSRNGCASCKRRRIKCDETKPQCSNCTKHAVSCDYPSPVSQSPMPTQLSPASSTTVSGDELRGVEWGPITAELMHHWSTSTSCTLSEEPTLQTFMQVTVPHIAFGHEHVLHMILAISALHLSRLRPDQERFYTEHGERHYQAGVTKAIPALSDLNEENCHSVFMFAALYNVCTLAKGPKKGEYLVFSDSGPAALQILFQGILSVLSRYSVAVLDGPLAPLVRPGVIAAARTRNELPSQEEDLLEYLSDRICQMNDSKEDQQIQDAAMEHLKLLFSSCYGIDGQKRRVEMQDIGVWWYRCTFGLTALLQKSNHSALAIVAHACIVLNEISEHWIMRGWIPHLLGGIYERMPLEYRCWIDEPLQQIGWIPG